MRRRWPDLLDIAIGLAKAQARLSAVPVRRTKEIRTRPRGETVGVLRVTSTKGDGRETLDIQTDIWAPTYDAALGIDDALSQALDRNTCFEVDGLRITSIYLDGREHDDSEEGAVHTSSDFRLEAVWKH